MYIPTGFLGAQQKRYIATGGTTTTFTSGSIIYQSHTFNSNGTFQITQQATSDKILLLIVAGGGSGGAGEILSATYDLGGGGGGAGGARMFNDITSSVGSYAVVVGTGGAAVSGSGTAGKTGLQSQALARSTTAGGGGGGGYQTAGAGGGSGGGTGGGTSGLASPGTGTINEGNSGGYGCYSNTYCPSCDWTGGGGGGAGSAGQSSSSTAGCGDRPGGSGSYFNIRTGVDELYAEGGNGGGSATINPTTKGSGGEGGTPTAFTSAAGINGIVVITYPIRDERPTPAPSLVCEEYRFTAGGGGGTATYTLCGGVTQSNEWVGSSVSVDRCITSGSTKEMTGYSSTITLLGDCTP
tara:strand:- start:40 stop:1098 length:1059 start_codon:yes stop_codon:yes gene_type:complete